MDKYLYLGVLIVFWFSILIRVNGTLQCSNCAHISNPKHCQISTTCRAHEICSTDVHEVRGQFIFTLGCRLEADCSALSIFGKRAQSNHPLRCSKCCKGQRHDCNKDLCRTYAADFSTKKSTMTVPISTTPQSPKQTSDEKTGTTLSVHVRSTTANIQISSSTSTTSSPNTVSVITTEKINPAVVADCRDHEEDGFVCAMFDQFSFCSQTAAGLSSTIAHEKCPKHCGFCTSSGTVTTAGTSTTQAMPSSSVFTATASTSQVQTIGSSPPARSGSTWVTSAPSSSQV